MQRAYEREKDCALKVSSILIKCSYDNGGRLDAIFQIEQLYARGGGGNRQLGDDRL